MNTNLKLKLLITNGSEQKTVKTSVDLLLNPLYATESDVISVLSTVSDNIPNIRKSLFNSSLTVMRLTSKIEKLNILSDTELFHLRHDFTVCLAINECAKTLNKDLINAQSRSKTLGDFVVSTSIKGDTTSLRAILDDSLNCINEFKALISQTENERVLPATFVKGRNNISSKYSERLWWNGNNSPAIVDAFASTKYQYNGNLYKAGSFNIKRRDSNYVSDS